MNNDTPVATMNNGAPAPDMVDLARRGSEDSISSSYSFVSEVLSVRSLDSNGEVTEDATVDGNEIIQSDGIMEGNETYTEEDDELIDTDSLPDLIRDLHLEQAESKGDAIVEKAYHETTEMLSAEEFRYVATAKRIENGPGGFGDSQVAQTKSECDETVKKPYYEIPEMVFAHKSDNSSIPDLVTALSAAVGETGHNITDF